MRPTYYNRLHSNHIRPATQMTQHSLFIMGQTKVHDSGKEVVEKGVMIEEGKLTYLVLPEGMGGNEGRRPAAGVDDDV